jgi:IS30 family transposase
LSTGKEFALHELTDEVLGSTAYIAHLYHSRERGLNENTNGLLRPYVPKRRDFEKTSDERVREVQNKLNDRPRKCLVWRTPREVWLIMFVNLALLG